MQIKITDIIPLVFVWLWSTGFIGAKYGLPYIEPYFMLLVRFVIVIGLFYVMAQLLRSWRQRHQQAAKNMENQTQKAWRRLSAYEILSQILIGTLLHGAYLGGVFFAISQDVPAGIAAIIVGLQPILTALIGRIWMQQYISMRQIFGLLSGFLGISLVILDSKAIDAGAGGLPMVGLAACFIALVGISLGTILQKKLGQETPLLQASVFQYVGAAIIVAVLTYFYETQQVTYTRELFFAMGWLIFGLSIIAILLLMYMIRQGEVAKTASYFYLVPPATILQAWLLFDEKLGQMALFGCVFAAIGVFLVVRKTHKNT